MTRVADVIDDFNGLIGRTLAWAVLPLVVISFAVVFMRYALGKGYPWMQELYVWLHGAAVLLCAAWVLKEGGHVRMNLLYQKWSPRTRAWSDLLGVALFLYPMMGFLFRWSLPSIDASNDDVHRVAASPAYELVDARTRRAHRSHAGVIAIRGRC